jgi:radical SAM protein with 4Fe4S-binding SPASM domain
MQDMSLADFKLMLVALKETAVRTIDIIGGEPTLHPDIVLFVRELLRSGFSANISTNGTNLNILEEIMSVGNGVTVGISINDHETLEQTRGLIGIHKPIVKSVFHPNSGHGLIREILSLKPKKYYLIYRDALSRRDLRTTIPFPLFTSTVDRLFNLAEVGTVFCSGFLPDTGCYPELAQVRCPAGTTKLGILPDGSVYPCNLFFGKRKFFLGNILNDPFQDIWQHQALSYFRSTTVNPCTDVSCPHHSTCHGGCPAHSLFLKNDITAPDPRCSEIVPYLLAGQ